MSAAQPTEEEALAAIFPAQLEWRPIDGFARELRTRFGTLTIVRETQCPGTREPILYVDVRLDGALIESLGCTPDGEYYAVFLKNAFEVGDRDAVILSASAGGSGSPPPRLHLIVAGGGEDPRILKDPTFRSVDWTERVAADGNLLRFDLGYDEGLRRTATFDGTALNVERIPIAATPIPGARCEAVYRGLFDCAQRGRGRDLSGYEFPALMNAPWAFSTATRNGLRAILHHPGFSGDSYVLACGIAAATGTPTDYAAFQADVCTP